MRVSPALHPPERPPHSRYKPAKACFAACLTEAARGNEVGYYLVPSNTCHHRLLCIWDDTCLLYASPTTHNKESQTHTTAHRACCVRDRASSSHKRDSRSSTIKTTTPAPHQHHTNRDSSRGGGDQTSPATVYVSDFRKKGKRENKTYQPQITLPSENQKP